VVLGFELRALRLLGRHSRNVPQMKSQIVISNEKSIRLREIREKDGEGEFNYDIL
jgi:hypothetical protein